MTVEELFEGYKKLQPEERAEVLHKITKWLISKVDERTAKKLESQKEDIKK